ncbi:MAG: IS66 family insertion sequence element accessory protein TnpB [Thaumarchaeota archaeon]|nr:IS66 family insertion sequence element accessory protein TnpB [Nitrososphaerota archaeon]
MRAITSFQGIYLHRDPVDGRKAINGLCALVEEAQMGDPMGPHLFVFVNRRRKVLKILYFAKSGFALWQKRLELERFPWPKKDQEGVLKLSAEQLEWLLEGYDVWKMKPFEELKFEKFN